jgi:hypothetical protein
MHFCLKLWQNNTNLVDLDWNPLFPGVHDLEIRGNSGLTVLRGFRNLLSCYRLRVVVTKLLLCKHED